MLKNKDSTELSKFNPGWPVFQVEDIFEIQQGKQVSKNNRIGDNQRPFLRTKNVMWGRLDLAQLDQMHFTERDEKRLALRNGDLLLCEGGSVGRAAIWRGEVDRCYYQNHLHRLRIVNGGADPKFALYWFWYAFELGNVYFGRKNVTTIPNMSKSRLGGLPMPRPELLEQQRIAAVLSLVQRAIEQQERLIALTTELKKALMHKLFTEGTRGEPQKETEIGPVPESWEAPTVESVCTIKASAMSYKQLENATEVPHGVRVIGVKVSDMNLPRNENEFVSANLERHLSKREANNRAISENSIVFPKRGAAIATNKKRLTTCRTVLDPNLIAVTPNEEINHKYLFHWFNTFDLKRITDPGPTPQLNKKDIAPLKFPMPPIEEQDEIASAIDRVEATVMIHSMKKTSLQDLFRTLLHQLMTAEIRVNDLDLKELGLDSEK